jgi:hypothetical protein
MNAVTSVVGLWCRATAAVALCLVLPDHVSLRWTRATEPETVGNLGVFTPPDETEAGSDRRLRHAHVEGLAQSV